MGRAESAWQWVTLQAGSQDRAAREVAGRSTSTRCLDTVDELLFGKTKGGVGWCASHTMSTNPYGAGPALPSLLSVESERFPPKQK